MNITVIGAGVIGISWTGLFLVRGHHVTVYDIAEDAEERVRQGLENILPTLEAIGDTAGMHDRLRVSNDLADAVGNADVVQENGPERRDFKRQLWADVERHVPSQALLLSSSSGITASMQAAEMTEPSRMLIGHPFNPPHLIPLVEVVPGRKTDPMAVDEAMAFYASLGKVPIRLHKEIPGFVANRLQAALVKESMALVRADVVSVSELDAIVVNSVGLRWATAGPFQSFHLGGGPTGFRGFLKHFSRGVRMLWAHSAVRPVLLTPRLQTKLLDQIDGSFGALPIAELEQDRDHKQLGILAALAKDPDS